MLEALSHDWLRDHWWVFLLRGLAAITFGVLIVLWPGISLVALIYLFGAFALVDGAFTLVGALMHREPRWGWHVVDGLAGLAIGVMVFAWTIDTAVVLLYFMAAWAIVFGAVRVVLAFRARHLATPAWLLGLGGVASVIFGVAVMAFPGAGALAILMLIAAWAILIGVLLVIVAVRLKTTPSAVLATT